MRNHIGLLFLIVLLSLTTAAFAVAQETETLTVKEGVGIGGIVVSVSTRKDVVAEFGGQTMLIGHDDKTSEMSYDDLGISFWYRKDDPQERIIRISLEAPAVAITTKGIALDKHTLRDAAAVYGKAKLRVKNCADSRYYEYPGIQFHVEYDFDNESEASVIEKKIIEIDIVPVEAQP